MNNKETKHINFAQEITRDPSCTKDILAYISNNIVKDFEEFEKSHEGETIPEGMMLTHSYEFPYLKRTPLIVFRRYDFALHADVVNVLYLSTFDRLEREAQQNA